MLTSQRDKFLLPGDISYLNCAYMAPNLKAVEKAGIEGIRKKNHPYKVFKEDFFEPVVRVKKLFAQLIHLKDHERIALIPSVSYGIATVARNIRPKSYGNIVITAEQFPSNYYAWKRFADTYDLQLRMVRPPEGPDRGRRWNKLVMDSIDNKTVVVAMGNVHWTDGTKFNLEDIRQKTLENQALLVVDGTQSVGAMPFDVSKLKPDALICAGYKWLFCPYSTGMAYYSEVFDDGIPIEESWMNRKGSDNFQGLVNYEDKYLPKAARYTVGESSNFTLIPMMEAALTQILEWTPEKIQAYCQNLAEPFFQQLAESGATIEEKEYRGSHLAGVRINGHIDSEKLKALFDRYQVFISMRSSSVRISTHVFNTEEDLSKLVECFRKAAK